MSRTVAEFCDDSPDTLEALRVMRSVCGQPPADLAPRLAPAERTRIRRMLQAAQSMIREQDVLLRDRYECVVNMTRWERRCVERFRDRLLDLEDRCMTVLEASCESK